jgi:hypothetical protein
VRENVLGMIYSHGFMSDWIVILGLMLGFTSVKFEAENLAVAVLFCGTVEVVLEEVGAAWDNPAKRRVTSVVEKNILIDYEVEGGFLDDEFLS